ncbi:site-2 protease family protein [Rhodocista pekingensis]|uniref:Site-2 protease family protein n=1 Tax=Rhodocista pekingensis TaxID=201185 RepID=A0ABW2KR74_9PROT
MPDIGSVLFQISIIALPVVIAITFHEAAHGWVARRLGDDTAYLQGRVTFNPLKHIDPVGTVLLPGLMFLTTGFLFGWAKPVPVDFRNLRDPRRDMVWVALAGPGVNIALALVSALLLHVVPLLPPYVGEWLGNNLQVSILINVILAVFNMLPLPPLDGGRVAVGLLPDVLAFPLARLERYGILILLLALILVPFASREFGYPVDPLRWIIGPPVDYIIDLIARVTGLS